MSETCKKKAHHNVPKPKIMPSCCLFCLANSLNLKKFSSVSCRTKQL